ALTDLISSHRSFAACFKSFVRHKADAIREIRSNANLVVIYGLHQVNWWYVLASDVGLKLSSLLYLDAIKVLEDGDLQTLGMLILRLTHSLARCLHFTNTTIYHLQRLRTLPGCSLIEVNDSVVEFYSLDERHSEREEIYRALRGLMKSLRSFEYLPDLMELEQGVAVYPSEFGLQRMKEEAVRGPLGFFKDENEKNEDQDDNKLDSEDDDEIDYEKLACL
ncbi:hypothetical protein CMV_028008, partial [Castanea mollissima]